MRLSAKTLVLSAITAVDVVCLVGVVALARGALPRNDPAPLALDLSAGYVAVLETSSSTAARMPERPAAKTEGTELVVGSAPEGERLALERLRREAAADPSAFPSVVRRILDEDGADCRKVAALRALCEGDRAGAEELLTRTIAGPSPSCGDSVRRFALDLLARRARVAATARRSLADLVAGRNPALPRDLRSAAALELASSAPDEELADLSRSLAGETDEVLLAGVLEALSRRAPSAGRDAAAAILGGDFSAIRTEPPRSE
jgi:hypothetical protein